MLNQALEEGKRLGLSAMDALHIVAAHSVGAAQLVTAERLGKAIHQTDLVEVVTIA